jgi:hypothetical protein
MLCLILASLHKDHESDVRLRRLDRSLPCRAGRSEFDRPHSLSSPDDALFVATRTDKVVDAASVPSVVRPPWLRDGCRHPGEYPAHCRRCH